MHLTASSPVQSLADLQRLEATPLAQAMPWASTYDVIRASAQVHADRPALTFLETGQVGGPATTWTYRDLLQGIHQTANLLFTLGLRQADAVAVLLPGGLAYHLALWGGEAAGIVQPLNPLLSEDKLLSLLQASGAQALIAHGVDDDSQLRAKALRLQAQCPTLKTVLLVHPDGGPLSATHALPAGVHDFHAARAQQVSDRLISERVFQPQDIAAYFHTGGTTGAPKLARHSHGAQIFTAWANAQMQGFQSTDVTINGYPLFHVAGVLPGALCSLAVGMHILIPTASLFRNREVIANYWRLVAHHGCTLMSGVPTVLAALAAVPLNGADISSLRAVRTGAAPLPPELALRFEQAFGLQINESLGMTETAGLSTVAPPGLSAPAGCVGWPLPHASVRIVALGSDDQATAQTLPAGDKGMVLYKGPNLFSGYLDAAETARSFTPDGWLITGDVGFVDEQGRLHLTGRAKDLIIRGGHNIDPKVIEDALGAHPDVELCAAVGAPDAYAGELPVAFASLKPGAQVSEQELLAFTAERVDEAPAKPKRITILERMPVTNVGKIYKPELRTLATGAVVQALVDQVYGVNEMRPSVTAQGDLPVSVSLERDGNCDGDADLHRELQALIAALPVKVQVISAN
ncbi:acyl-CoA synthetase [Limnohabitans sp. MMS-10A-160]|uniref:acyl-CoA synthetase n=1 Tax=unclassified Limnohabitans TaxID=2626134 RepID=UPI000D38BE10|nr:MULTISPECIES: acyl-CoA synthetase [unclassified Limnohabitans]PUE20603.1 acyl-CoA synthetase [Limnohabitans sp. MMS-10A-192]PUE25009.1 acyl-CoA synthetase [Limnohabitans sp. MMS-10A-160]